MLLYQNQPETPGSLGRTRGSSGAPATVDGCNGGSRRRVRDPSLVEAGVSEEEGRKELRNSLSIEDVTEIVRRGRLRWFGHVERKADDDWVKKCTKVEVVGKVGRGRGRKTWLQCVNSDMKDLGLKVGEAQDRQLWRR